jgi:antitoxin component HigA of HigAB toxin-antitoxin module
MNAPSIRAKQDYDAALRVLSEYFDNEPEPGSEEGKRFETLIALVETYEARHCPVQGRSKTLADRLAASPDSPEEWGRDTAAMQDGPVGCEPL